MPNRLLLLLPLLAAGALAAQSVPDTTSAARYFPLEIGNTWEYDRAGLIEGYERRAIIGDSMVGDELYFRYRVDYFAIDGTPTDSTVEALLRIDPADNALRTPSGDPNEIAALFLTTCPLDSDFFDELFDCPGSAVVLTSGGPETVVIGEDSLETSIKYFDDNSREVLGTYAADIGFTGFLLRSGALTLEYAQVGGVSYGSPIPVSSSPEPAPGGALRISVFPNPSAGALTVRIDQPTIGPVLVQAWDALGRRVFRDTVIRQAGLTEIEIPATTWAPGLYLVSVAGRGERALTRVVRR